MRIRTCLFAVLFCALGLNSCEAPPDAEMMTSRTPEGRATVHLPIPFSAFLAGSHPQTLVSDGFFDVDYDTFGYIADVAVSQEGVAAVLDRMEKRVILFSPDGDELARLGREGRGPGEFVDPWAVTWMGDAVVVWNAITPFLTAFRESGDVVTSTGTEVSGDWFAHPFREPLFRIDFPYQMGEEDVTLRLNGLDSGHVGVVLQDDERFEERDMDAPEAYLTVWDSTLSVVDTLTMLPAPPMYLKQVRGEIYAYAWETFTPRSQWTAGDGWYATHVREQPWVTVKRMSGEEVLEVTWPDSLKEVAWEDRENRVDWYEIDRDGPISKEGKRRYASEWIEFSENAPEVMALYGWGRCLWISPFSSADYSNGTGLTLMIVHVDSRWEPKIVRIPRVGSRLRAASPRGMITTYEDDLGVQLLELYEVPGLDCTPVG